MMFFYCCVVSILSSIVSLIVEKGMTSWRLSSKTRLFALIYSGFFGSAFHLTIVAWCLHKKGPVFVSMFHPLGIVIAVGMGVIFLGDSFYLGSLLGSIVIALGFYSVMWGKAKEGKMFMDEEIKSLESGSEKAPLLQNNAVETQI